MVSRLFDDGPVERGDDYNPFDRIPEADRTKPRTEGDQGDPDFYDKWAKLEQKPKPFDSTKHYPKAISILKGLHPGKYWKADYKELLYKGSGSFPAVINKDMLGFADVLGITPPRGTAIAGQITTKTQVHAHLRKYTDPSKTHGSGKIPIETHLREFLSLGGRFYVIGFHQGGGKGSKWDAEVVEVTADVLNVYKSRKRK